MRSYVSVHQCATALRPTHGCAAVEAFVRVLETFHNLLRPRDRCGLYQLVDELRSEMRCYLREHDSPRTVCVRLHPRMRCHECIMWALRGD